MNRKYTEMNTSKNVKKYIIMYIIIAKLNMYKTW